MTYDGIMAKYQNADSLNDTQRFGTWLAIECVMNGRRDFWKEILDSHDTHGVPFDLLYVEIKGRQLIPESFTSEMFAAGMAKARAIL